MTEEKNVIDYSLIKEEVIISHPDWAGTLTELQTALREGWVIKDMRGGFNVPLSRLDDEMPEELPFSTKPVVKAETYDSFEIDEDGNETVVKKEREVPVTEEIDGETVTVMQPKTWGEYYGQMILQCVDAGRVLIPAVVSLNGGGAFRRVESNELHAMARELGITNVLTKSDFEQKVLMPEFDDEEI